MTKLLEHFPRSGTKGRPAEARFLCEKIDFGRSTNLKTAIGILAVCVSLWGCGSAPQDQAAAALERGPNTGPAALPPEKPLGSYTQEFAELERLQGELKQNKATYLADQAEADLLIETLTKVVADEVRDKTFDAEDGRVLEETIANHQEITKMNKRAYKGRARSLERQIKQQQERVDKAQAGRDTVEP